MEKAVGLITANYAVSSPTKLSEARPAASLPFCGRYRLIDFPLSNMVNCGINTVGLIMPYNYRSIIDHVGSGKDWSLDRKNGGLFVLPGSAFGTSRTGARFLLRDLIGNRVFLTRSKSPYVVVSVANMVFNCDLSELIDAHEASGADVTCLVTSSQEDDPDVTMFNVVDNRVKGVRHGVNFGETAFLDTFVIGREFLLKLLDWYAAVDYLDLFEALNNDYERVNVQCLNFDGYVASIFNVKNYFRRSMDMLDPELNDKLFPGEGRLVLTKAHDNPPAKYETGCHVVNSLVPSGCIVRGSVSNSILGREVVVESGATIRNSIVMQGVIVERGARVENAIVDRHNVVAAGTELRGTPEAVFIKEKGRL